MTEGKMKLNPSIFGVRTIDPGYIYIIENLGRHKIGKSKNMLNRLRSAQTWLPDMQFVGIKPFWNYSDIERNMHAGFSQYWYFGEWFDVHDEYARQILLQGFLGFSDIDIDRNSVDFIYWFNGDGMAEIASEMYRQKKSLRKFQREESLTKKNIFHEKPGSDPA